MSVRFDSRADECPRWESNDWFWRDSRFQGSLPDAMPEFMKKDAHKKSSKKQQKPLSEDHAEGLSGVVAHGQSNMEVELSNFSSR